MWSDSSLVLVLLWILVTVLSVEGQVCRIQSYVNCHELCDLALQDPAVVGVYFEGVVADFDCLPAHMEVSISIFHIKTLLFKCHNKSLQISIVNILRPLTIPK